MVDLAVVEGLLAAGAAPSVVARGRSARSVAVLRRKVGRVRASARASRWTDDELRFVRQHLGRLGLQEIAAHLGRSVNAIKIMYQRQGWPAPSKQAEEFTAPQVAKLLGRSAKGIVAMIDLGILPGRVVPGGRKIHVVRRITLERWLIKPASWIYFKAQRIRDPRLRRLVELARRRWPDEWLTTGQAARLLGLKSSGSIDALIRRGKLPARQWLNQWVKRSHVEGLDVRGTGRGPRKRKGPWTDRGDAFLLRARAEGKTWEEIGHLMGPHYGGRRAPYRWKCLQRGSTE